MQQLQLIHLADLGHQVTLKNIDTISSIDLLVYPLSLSSQPDLNDAVLAELHRRRSGNKEDSTSIEKLPFESFDSGTNLKTLSSVNLLVRNLILGLDYELISVVSAIGFPS